MTTLTAIRFKDMVELSYPNNNVFAILPYSKGKEEIIIKGIYKTIKKEVDKNCQFNEEVVKLYYHECR